MVCPTIDFFVQLIVSAVEAPKATQILLSNFVKCSPETPVTELQATASTFHSNYVFYLIVEGLMVFPFCRDFVVRHINLPLQGFEATYPIFEI